MAKKSESTDVAAELKALQSKIDSMIADLKQVLEMTGFNGLTSDWATDRVKDIVAEFEAAE